MTLTRLQHVEFLLSERDRLFPSEITQLLQEREVLCIALLLPFHRSAA